MSEVKIIAEASTLKNVLNMGGKSSRDQSEGALIELMKSGMIISAVNKTCTTMVMVAVSKRAFKEYKCGKVMEKTLIEGDLGKILDALPAGDKKVTIIIDPEDRKLKLNYDKIKRKIDIFHDTNAIEKAKGSQRTLKNVFGSTTMLGKLEGDTLTEFMNYMKAASSMGYGEKHTAIERTKKEFNADTELDDNDNLILNIEKIMENATDEEFWVLLQSDELAQGMAKISKLTDNIQVNGGQDYPFLLTCHGTDPNDAGKFKEDVEVWWLLAPRIEAED